MNQQQVADRILELANCYPEVTTSDLQGMAFAIAGELIRDIRGAGPRPPSTFELVSIASEMSKRDGLSRMESGEVIQATIGAVFESFMPDGPGYCGKVAVVVHSGGGNIIESYGFRPNGDAFTLGRGE